MEQPAAPEQVFAELGEPDEEQRVYDWRTEQLSRLGFSKGIARAFADVVDWHDIAALVERGCAPMLALEIVR
jgi:hypothetical protein